MTQRTDQPICVSNGRFEFKLAYRDLGDDGGPAIHVFGPTPSGREEVLRFDCFRKEPHYHLAWSYRSHPFERIDSDAPFEWALAKIRADLNSMLQDAEAEPMNDTELEKLPSVIEELAAAAQKFAA